MKGSKEFINNSTALKDISGLSEEYCHEIFENSGIPMMVLEDSVVSWGNKEFQKLTGYSNTELKGKNWNDLVFNENISIIMDLSIKNTPKISNKSNFSSKHKFNHLMNESTGKSLIFISHLPGKSGRIASIVSITDHDEVEKQLKFQANILENIQESVVVTGSHGMIKYWNEAATSIFGYSRDEVMGKSMAMICRENDEGKFLVTLKGISDGEKCAGEHECRRKDGSIIWMDVRTTEMFDEEGNQTGFLNVSKDITERKKVQNDMETALKEKEMLLDEIHGRVKNYIQMVLNFLEIQSKYLVDREDFGTIKDSKNRVNVMFFVHDCLFTTEDFATVEFSEYIQMITQNIVNSYTVTGGITFDVTVDNVLLDIETAVPCGLIVNELFTNSIKHAFPNGRKGHVVLNFSKDNHGICVLRVEDNGVGFQNVKVDKIGLNIVNSMVEALNGEINVSNHNGTSWVIKFRGSEY
ncbi:PAS domain S-box protein [Methanobacterium aggregans]|uniref:PAS domain S-box protein n=1 Tax=Methanobacterium aggregans TaxID=1615586 RepID=UPI001AE985F6|nr:PAS domain S-box protein [Methanobacterium aggregans]MBP2046964.1 PAS domain S-box-containing protein [Methanobacterium aggregans]